MELRWSPGRLRVPGADLALGLGVGALVATSSLLEAGSLGFDDVLITVLVAAAVAGRRCVPVFALVSTNGLTLFWFAYDDHGRLITVAPLIVCYTLAADRGLRAGLLGWLFTAAATVVGVRFALGGGWLDYRVLDALQLEAGTVALGAATHFHRAFAAGAAERAERIAHASAEQAKAKAAEERLEVARELHDVFGHTLAAISVQSGVAIHVMRRQPAQAASALNTIKQISDEGLAEVQVLLGAMRSTDLRTLTASGGLAHLDKLIEVTRATGIAVELCIHGADREVPVAVDLAAFRIIQEALTNVRRHARASTVLVRLTYGARELEVVVRNDGKPVANGTTPAGGHGIAGMRGRALALGGTWSAGPLDGGGFEVRCVLPTRKDA